jgi:REP element-mobilizing transposase RayT
MELFRKEFRIPSARLAEYDYNQPGFYFVTICTKDKKFYFGKIVDYEMVLNDIGKMAQKFWLEIPEHFPHVQLDEFIIMPNHVHGIIYITERISPVETQNFASLHLSTGPI